MTNALRYIFGILLLVGGFMIGAAWNTPSKNNNNSATDSSAQSAPSARADEDIIAEIPAELNPDEKATIRLFENASPSVAYITTSSFRQSFYNQTVTEVPKGSGSGFIWDNKGHVVTNFHVVQGADKFLIQLAHLQEGIEAELVGVAPSKDLAVLQLKTIPDDITPLPVGGSENLLVGQSVYAIGNPFGLDYTLTTGIISALGREIEGTDGTPIKDVIQTDAAINPGNSGGPLLNSSGKLIGVNTAIYSPSGAYAGIGFSIPVDAVKWVVPELIKYGKIQRPTLGVSLANSRIMAQLRMEGVLVVDVERGSAADRAGIQPTKRSRFGDIVLGDVIVGINDDAITKYGDLILALEKYKPGQEITVKVMRDEKEVELQLTLDEARD